MSPREKKVLRALGRSPPGYVAFFSELARRTRMKKREVRVVCRSLARKGIAKHVRGLWYDGGPKDGMLAGSGYAITKAGVVELEREK